MKNTTINQSYLSGELAHQVEENSWYILKLSFKSLAIACICQISSSLLNNLKWTKNVKSIGHYKYLHIKYFHLIYNKYGSSLLRQSKVIKILLSWDIGR